MKQTILNPFALLFFVLVFFSCKKDSLSADAKGRGHLQQTKTFSSDVVKRWLAVQTNMLNRPSGNPFSFNPSRYMAYCGLAVYEAVVPGMPAYQSLVGQLTDMPEMPQTHSGYQYHWPTAANAALSSMTRKFFSPVTAAYNAAAVDNLEAELNNTYRSEVGNDVFTRSWNFGIEVADSIYRWAQKDNQAWPAASYQLPAYYPGMWMPESGAPAAPYWGYNRLIVPGSLTNVVSPPLEYSTNPASAYYKDMKEVYTVSQNLTHDQKLIAKYFNDANPGLPAGAHYISTVKQLMEQVNPMLDKAALTYMMVGIVMLDASTGSFKYKYQYLKERPFQFIRTHIASGSEPTWQPFLPTPAFPDFPSNHAVFSSGVVHVLKCLYGNNVSFSDASYEGVMADLGNGPENLGTRHYRNFDEMEEEISMSRLYGGIHYRYSCSEGRKQGRQTAQNIFNAVQYLK